MRFLWFSLWCNQINYFPRIVVYYFYFRKVLQTKIVVRGLRDQTEAVLSCFANLGIYPSSSFSSSIIISVSMITHLALKPSHELRSKALESSRTRAHTFMHLHTHLTKPLPFDTIKPIRVQPSMFEVSMARAKRWDEPTVWMVWLMAKRSWPSYKAGKWWFRLLHISSCGVTKG